jgi:hypothetical protein
VLIVCSFWHLQGPNGIETVRKRIEDTSRSLKMMHSFLQERAALEEQYASGLRELLKRHSQAYPDPWSTNDAWKALRAEAEETQKMRTQLSQQIASEVTRPLEFFHRQQAQTSKLVCACWLQCRYTTATDRLADRGVLCIVANC